MVKLPNYRGFTHTNIGDRQLGAKCSYRRRAPTTDCRNVRQVAYFGGRADPFPSIAPTCAGDGVTRLNCSRCGRGPRGRSAAPCAPRSTTRPAGLCQLFLKAGYQAVQLQRAQLRGGPGATERKTGLRSKLSVKIIDATARLSENGRISPILTPLEGHA